MKITDLHVDGFGVWTRLSVDEISSDATVFFGRNEAGKTTLMQFLRAMLYGFSPARRERYLPPVNGGRPGGTLYIDAADAAFELQRHATTDVDDAEGELAVFDADGAGERPSRVAELLAGIDEAIFNNVFAVGLREIQELGTLNDTQAAEQLYRLTSGVDRVSLVEVMRELSQARGHLLSPEGKPAEIARLLEQRDALRQQLERHAQRARRWPALYGQQRAVDAEVRELQQAMSRLEQQARVVEVAVQLRERWEQRAELRSSLDQLRGLPQLPDRALARLDRVNAKAAVRRQRLEEIKQERFALREEAAALPLNRNLWKQRARIEAVGEHTQWIASLENQIARLGDEAALLEVEHESHWGELGIDGGDPSQMPDLSRRVISSLREPARAMREENARLEQAQKDHDANRKEVERLELEVDTVLNDRGQTDLVEALDAKGELVSQLRRRIQLEERIEQLHRHRDELEDESHDLLDGQVLPLKTLIAIGVIFVAGVMVLLFGLMGLFGVFGEGLTTLGGLGLMFLGVCAFGLALASKVMLERNATGRLHNCNDQLDAVATQISDAREEREELDKQLPSGGGPIDMRLKRAEEELKELEALLPLDAARRGAAQRAESAALQIANSEEALEEAKRRWRDTLRSVGLPAKLSPSHVRKVAQRSRNLSDVRERLTARRQELAERENELTAVQCRIEQLAEDVGLESEGVGPQPLLRQLTSELAVQRGWFDKRMALVRQERSLRRERRRVLSGLQKLLDYRRSLFAQAAVSDEEGLRELAAQHEEAARMRHRQQQLSEQIAAMLGAQVTENDVAETLQESTQVQLEQRWDVLVARIEDDQKRLAELHERRGALRQEMKSLTEEQRLSEAKLEFAALERRLARAVRRWRVLAATGLLLERIRDIYEKERQPETLQEASQFLEQLTDGHYVRVWTPLDMDVLRVDNEHGQALSVELLSRGTREAVFLALRLALITQYAKRGVVLPVILDDVLVNFDADRTRLAAKVLRDFAKDGHQLLLFTCHEHIMKAFKKLKVEVRELPSRDVHYIPPEAEEEEELEEELEPAAIEVEEEFELAEPLEVEPLEVDDEPIEEADYEFADEEPLEQDDYSFAEDEAEDYMYVEEEEELELADVEEEDTQVEAVDWIEDDEYRLGPPPEHLPYTLLDDQLEAEETIYELAAPEQESPPEPKRLTFQKPAVEPRREVKPQRKPEPPIRSGFTWESPEMWWRERPGDAA
ncbi:MAG: AAA family ATPase [Pirellulaceae bacterium]